MSQPTVELCRALLRSVTALDASDPVASEAAEGAATQCQTVEGEYELGLHIGAVFIILVASVVGTVIPILGKHVPVLRLHAYVYAVGKSTATGVVLAVALIHMINEGVGDLNQDCVSESFREMYEAWAFLFAMIAAVLMHAVDGTVAWVARRWTQRAVASGVLNPVGSGDVGRTEPCSDSLCKECPARDAEARQDCERGECAGDDCDAAVEVVPRCTSERSAAHAGGAECVGHQHGVAVPTDMPTVQRVTAALCMEFGVTLHSVFAGLAVAVSNGSDLRVLIIALVFHQLFEGLAMGARLADAPFKLSLELVLMLVFSVSAPVGIAAGTGAIAASRDALSSPTYAVVSGVLDSVCGGIMLYIAFSLMLVDFAYDLTVHCADDSLWSVVRRMGLYAGLWIGAGVMALIGKWL